MKISLSTALCITEFQIFLKMSDSTKNRKISEDDSTIKRMYNKRIFTDFDIVSNDRPKFPCHRAVMRM